MTLSAGGKIDFSKTHKALYTATAKVKEVQADRATFLCFEGQGEPGGTAFQDAIGQTYAVAYTAKFGLRQELPDFAVSRLETLWYVCDSPDQVLPRSEWRWRILVRIPDELTEEHLHKVRHQISEKKRLDTSAVKRIEWEEGRALQTMHVGPYDQVPEAYARLDQHARQAGVVLAGPGHEIYISDPRRVEPEKLKTIVRLAVKA